MSTRETNVRNIDGIEIDLFWKRTNPSIECVSRHRTDILSLIVQKDLRLILSDGSIEVTDQRYNPIVTIRQQ
jgi:hypothetical protein